MVFHCSWCKAGPMTTSDQYVTHIKSTKHVKKAFQMQAPYAGIEYEEFRPKVAVVTKKFEAVTEDFPQLSDNLPVATESVPIQYVNIVGKLNTVNTNKVNETNGSLPSDQVEKTKEEKELTIDEVFIKDLSRIESARHTITLFIKKQKTATATLNEVAVAMGWKLEFEPVPATENNFGFMVMIDKVNLVQGEADNKKEAKQNASTEALKIIRRKLSDEKKKFNEPAPVSANTYITGGINQNIGSASIQANKGIGVKKETPPADAYCRLTIDKLIDLENLQQNKFVIPRRYAAFIITESSNQLAKDGVVVAFGAGKGTLKKNQDIKEHPGFHITNFDALVLARRSFQCFIYNQLGMLFNKNGLKSKFDKLYLTIGKDGTVSLKRDCRVHLFMSHAPYGDCVDSIPPNWIDPKQQPAKEADRDKKGIVEPLMSVTYSNNQYVRNPGHIRVLKDDHHGGWLSLVELRSKSQVIPESMVMSPSDKLMTWIHVGLEGALLSHLVAPIHLYSVQVANDYLHEHFSRAVMCRVPIEKLEDITDMSKYKDPFISRVSKLPDTVQPLIGLGTKNVSYNWYLNPVTMLPEIINNETGLVHTDSPYKLPDGDPEYQCSRLAKVCMLVRLKNIFALAVDYFAMRPELQKTRYLQGIGAAAGHKYHLYKNGAVKYRALKRCLFQSLHERSLGDWAPNHGANDFDLLHHYQQ